MQLIVQKRGYRFLPFLVLAVAVAMLGFLVLNTEAVHNDKLLELDGNVVFNGGRGPNAGDSPCDGALPTSAPFFTPGPPDCIQTATPATFDWAGSAVGNGTGVCKAGADNPATAGNEANLIVEDTKPAGVATSVCVRDFAVGTVDGPALGQGTLCQPSSTCSVGDTADLSYHTGSDKDFQEIWDGSSADWGCVEQSNATNKADLLNSYFVRTKNQAGDDIFYFGAERNAEQGSVFNGFWFLQNPVRSDCPRNLVFPSGAGDFCSQTKLENATCTPASNQSKHKNKDTLVLFNYDNGGRIGSIGVYVWDYGALASSSAGLPCPNGLGTRTTADHLCQVENLDVNATNPQSGDCRLRDTINSVCGRVNGSPTCVPTNSKPQYCSGPGAIVTPWAPGCGSGTNCRQASLASPTFSEAGVNLTRLGITLGCVQSFLSESRSSPSVDATLKDYALGGLPPCGLAWEKRDETVSGHPLQGGATFTITPSPFGGASLVVTDCTAAPCAAGGDDDPDAGSFNLSDVQPNSYQVCETTAPTGYAKDNSLCRSVTVSSAEPNTVIGTQDVDDCANAAPDEQDFCNRRGTVAWEKRDGSAAGDPLQGGATFTVAPNPDACVDADNTGSDDTSPITVVDNGTNDDSAAAGVLSIGPACIATYTITETVAPAGYALPANPTRTCQVTEAALSCVVGDQGTDDCANATVAEQDFCNRRGSLAWEKRDGSSANVLQGGATFTVAPNPDACVDADNTGPDDTSPITVVDNGANDDNSAAGVFEVGPACLATYTITETVPPPGYALPANATRTCQVTSTALTCVVGTQGTDDCATSDAAERDFCNRRGSLAWEKRDGSLSGDPLQGGATFTVAPDPDDCTDGTVGDDPGPITVVDNGANDDNSAAGVIEVGPACLATYTITETVPPAGYALPANATRTCQVTSAALSCVVGDQGTDDCANSDAAERDFCNRRGSLAWEKRDGSAAGDPLQGGAAFTVSPDPDDCTDGVVGDDLGPITVVDNGANDDNSAAGQLSVGPACLAFYSITETVAPPGYALPSNPSRSCAVNVSDLNCSVGT
jgi:hypothetical protein